MKWHLEARGHFQIRTFSPPICVWLLHGGGCSSASTHVVYDMKTHNPWWMGNPAWERNGGLSTIGMGSRHQKTHIGIGEVEQMQCNPHSKQWRGVWLWVSVGLWWMLVDNPSPEERERVKSEKGKSNKWMKNNFLTGESESLKFSSYRLRLVQCLEVVDGVAVRRAPDYI